MWIPLVAAWMATASMEEIEHHRNFIGPPKPAINQQQGNAEKRPDTWQNPNDSQMTT